MGKAARKKPIKPTKRRSSTLGFSAVLAVVALVGVAGILASRGNDRTGAVGPAIGDHWHAAFGVNVCGEWKPHMPPYEVATGIHSHGDGFIHLHPGSRAGAYERATVGLYVEQAGEKISDTEIRLNDGTRLRNGDECPNLDNQPGKVRWALNGEEQPGDPSRHVPADGDIVAIAFLPEGEEIGIPPHAAAVPSDIPGGEPQIPQELLEQLENQIQDPAAETEGETESPPSGESDPATGE